MSDSFSDGSRWPYEDALLSTTSADVAATLVSEDKRARGKIVEHTGAQAWTFADLVRFLDS